jgi:methionine-gamma-lyase
MAAINSVYLTFLGQGAHAVVTDCVYGPTRTILESEYARFGVQATFVDSSHPDNVARALRPNTKLVFVESPANPTLKLTDIARCADIAHRVGAILVVDNTFASPYLQNPLQLGADVVVHSMTKFINGHTDVVAGIIVARKEEVLERIRSVHVNLGGTMDPHQAWLVLRGIKTLGLRMERAQANARALAYYLQRHAAVKWVNYPGLVDHPQHDLMKQQMRGPGAIVCFGVRGGLEAGRRFINSVQLATLAVSLGGIETLIEHPASMTHAGVSAEERRKAGVTDDLVRIAVGCEDYDDLERDFEQAFEKAMTGEGAEV